LSYHKTTAIFFGVWVETTGKEGNGEFEEQ
jgi:hypothetical protein